MKVLITGGLGFIGRIVTAKLLDNGHSVRIIDNLSEQIHGVLPVFEASWQSDPRVEIVRGDVTDEQQLARAVSDIDAVAHLAAETGTGQSMYQISRYNLVNSQGTAHLLQALIGRRESPISKLVLASSRSIYGEGAYQCGHCADGRRQVPASRSAAQLSAAKWEPECDQCGTPLTSVPTAEDSVPRPASIYAATKLAQEDLVRIFSESTGVATTSLRFQNVYGEGQSLNNPYTGILSIFSTRLRRGLRLPIFEDGLESRDFIHVDDIARAIVMAIEAPTTGYKVFNVGSGVATSVLALAGLLAARFGMADTTDVTGQFRLGDIRHCTADMSRIGTELGFRPAITLQQGLDRFVEWVAAQPLPEDRLSRAESELRKHGLMGAKH